ncbi:DoxX family protein [Burkholderia ubonensis]|uniref:DoxX family protein n=1 Tax=Burkholderia ubonensis TaxID=101571 RepID=UPI000A4CAEFD|nr:DoxX family protein [Burkholderia ubonensis]
MGYVISDNRYGNYKLPLIYLMMFVPLIFQGAGKFSLDYWLGRRLNLVFRRGHESCHRAPLAPPSFSGAPAWPSPIVGHQFSSSYTYNASRTIWWTRQ